MTPTRLVDDARDLADRIEVKRADLATVIANLVAEDQRLESMHASLLAFIEQPAQDDGVPSPSPAPAPRSAAVSSPPGDGSPAITQPGSDRSEGAGHALDESVGNPTPASHNCPDCDRTFSGPIGLGIHRSRVHGIAGGQHRPEPLFEPKKRRDGSVQCPTCHDWFVSAQALGPHRRQRHGHRAGQRTEQYLCARCPQTFTSAADCKAHEATHGQVEAEFRPLGRNPTTRQTPDGVPVA